MMIRKAKATDSDMLTKISFASKAYWKYPETYFEILKQELTISPEYILNNDVFVFKKHALILGYYSLVNLEEDLLVGGFTISKGMWLDHMFIEPGHIREGIGRKLFQHMRNRCMDKGVQSLGIIADPNARVFYEKMGCRYVCEYPSTIQGRTTPYLRYSITTCTEEG